MKDLTTLRTDLFALITEVAKHKISAEMTLAYRSLQLGRGWLGKAKGVLGEETPYTVVDNVADIPKTADANITKVYVTQPDHLAYVNVFRKELKKIIADLINADFSDAPSSEDPMFWSKLNACVASSWSNLEEASMWLGFELERLREENLKK